MIENIMVVDECYPHEEKPVTKCTCCGKGIFEGEFYYRLEKGERLCEECLEDNYMVCAGEE